MINFDNSLSVVPDNNNLIPTFKLEIARASFSPESQNTVGILAAAREPISVNLITHYASNADGLTPGNPVLVTEEDVRIVIDTFRQAEIKFGVKLLETAPIKTDQKVKQLRGTALNQNSGNQEPEMGFRLNEQVQKFVEQHYPGLWRAFHGMFADRMIEDLKLLGINLDGPSTHSKKTEEIIDIVNPGDTLGKLVDGAATKLIGPGK
jgi:hypothetical protein